MHWSFTPVGSYWLVGLAAFVLLVLLRIGPAIDRTTRRRRQVLVGLRLAAILLAIVALLRPTLVYVEVRKQPSTLILLVDRTRSMLVADAVGKQTRWQALRAAID